MPFACNGLQVDAPVSKVFEIWEDRMNWNDWFDLIGQVGCISRKPKPLADLQPLSGLQTVAQLTCMFMPYPF